LSYLVSPGKFQDSTQLDHERFLSQPLQTIVFIIIIIIIIHPTFGAIYSEISMEAGYNTSTIDLRVIKGDEKGAWGYNWTTLSLGVIITGTWSSRMGGLDARLTTWLCRKKYFCKIQRCEYRMFYTPDGIF
jgi:hypothetical protein